MDTGLEEALSDALRRHRAAITDDPSQPHGCVPGCADDLYGLLEPRPAWSATCLRSAWLAHWDEVPNWNWTADNVWDTDHRCAVGCVPDIASRLCPA